jgi:hypothetical protein
MSQCHPEVKPKDLAFCNHQSVEILHSVQNDSLVVSRCDTVSRWGDKFIFVIFVLSVVKPFLLVAVLPRHRAIAGPLGEFLNIV